MAGLPNVPGPKLYPFDTGGEPLQLEFIKELGHGLHAYVWEVQINGKVYALKIFTYYHVSDETYGVELSEHDEEHLDDYLQPFQCECRAFGRLKEFGMQHLGVGCYGYLTLDEAHIAFLREKYDFERHWDYQQEYDENEPVRAIVKDLLDMGHGLPPEEYVALHVTPEAVPKVFEDLKSMHQLGISIGDVSFENYIHGKYVDLSHAITAPHPLLLKHKDPDKFPPLKRAVGDARGIDDLIDEWNRCYPHRRIWDRLLPDPGYVRRLRPRKARMKARWPFHPEDFTYQAAVEIFKYKSPRCPPPVKIKETKKEQREGARLMAYLVYLDLTGRLEKTMKSSIDPEFFWGSARERGDLMGELDTVENSRHLIWLKDHISVLEHI